MKVWQLKKINEVSNNLRFNLDYERLLKMNDEDIQLLVDKIEEENENFKSLCDFLSYIADTPDWKESFSHLKGIEDINLKEYIFNQIANAPSPEDADTIFNYFDLNNYYNLSIFKTVEEWKTYVESINTYIEEIDNLLVGNLAVALKYSKKDRCNLIKKIMNYSLSNYYGLADWSEYLIDYEKMPISFSELINLYQKEYNQDAMIDLLNTWIKKRNDYPLDESKKVDDSFQKVVDYLKESDMMPKMVLWDFNYVLDTNDIDNYPQIINVLKMIEEKGTLKILEKCIDKNIPFDNPNMLHYIDSILELDDNNMSLRYALISLWDTGVVDNNIEDRENIESIITALTIAEENY